MDAEPLVLATAAPLMASSRLGTTVVGMCWAHRACPVLWDVFGIGGLKPVGLMHLGQAFARALLVLRAGTGSAGPSSFPGTEEAELGRELKRVVGVHECDNHKDNKMISLLFSFFSQCFTLIEDKQDAGKLCNVFGAGMPALQGGQRLLLRFWLLLPAV